MIKHDINGLKLPALGLGCMRLPTDGDRNIDTDEVAKMVEYAMANGVNYFDNGYDYHGGSSEAVMAEALSGYPRDSYFLADKFPGYNPLYWRRVNSIFEEQLTRSRTDHFDLYLLHNVSEFNIDAYLNPRYNIIEYLKGERDAGRIRRLGFSAHGSVETIARLLDECEGCFEFAQIQLNYIDYDFQHAKDKLELLKSRGLPVMVMEPLRGGKLARPSGEHARLLEENFSSISPHEAAFRFILGFPEVCLTLSGMSNLEQLKSNVEIFNRAERLTDAEHGMLIDIGKQITRIGTIPCTACRYCTEHCPIGLDIPLLIEYYNEHTFSGGGFIVPSAIAGMKRDKRPTACIGCGKCEELCPQGIKVSSVMKELTDKLNLK